MALFNGVRHDLVGGHDGQMAAHVGVVLHVNDSDGSLDNWVANQGNEMSCHVEVYKNGAATQYVDTDYASWCQEYGNPTYISFETEGYPGEWLTVQQVHRLADLYAQCHRIHGIPLELAEHPGDAGFGWHGMGGEAWGGHPDCPGDKRRSQRKQVLDLTRDIIEGRQPSPQPTRGSKPVPQPIRLYPVGKGDAERLVSHDRRGIVFLDDDSRIVVHRDHQFVRTA